MRRTIVVVMALWCAIVLGTENVQAGALFVSGDATPAFYASDSGNDVFFQNILQGGNSVLVHDLANDIIGNNLSSYYSTLSGVSSSYAPGDPYISAGLLSGVDLFVTGLTTNGLNASELAVLDGYLASGGTLFFMGEYVTTETYINNALSTLGSGMSLTLPFTTSGTHYVTGSDIATDPYTSGVNTFTYGYSYGVLGGTALFFEGNRALLAYEHVPEPTTIALLGLGLAGLGFSRRKKV